STRRRAASSASRRPPVTAGRINGSRSNQRLQEPLLIRSLRAPGKLAASNLRDGPERGELVLRAATLQRHPRPGTFASREQDDRRSSGEAWPAGGIHPKGKRARRRRGWHFSSSTRRVWGPTAPSFGCRLRSTRRRRSPSARTTATWWCAARIRRRTRSWRGTSNTRRTGNGSDASPTSTPVQTRCPTTTPIPGVRQSGTRSTRPTRNAPSEPAMRYFTPELYQQFNSFDVDEAERADEGWDRAEAAYKERLARIREHLPSQVVRLSEL